LSDDQFLNFYQKSMHVLVLGCIQIVWDYSF
jgi:hypothetical protein